VILLYIKKIFLPLRSSVVVQVQAGVLEGSSLILEVVEEGGKWDVQYVDKP